MPEIAWSFRALASVLFSIQLEAEQACISWICCRFRSAAWHRIWFRTSSFVPMPQTYSETNQWLKDWAKQSSFAMSTASVCNIIQQNPRKFCFHVKNNCCHYSSLQSIKLLLPAATATGCGNALRLHLPVLPASKVAGARPKHSVIASDLYPVTCLKVRAWSWRV